MGIPNLYHNLPYQSVVVKSTVGMLLRRLRLQQVMMSAFINIP